VKRTGKNKARGDTEDQEPRKGGKGQGQLAEESRKQNRAQSSFEIAGSIGAIGSSWKVSCKWGGLLKGRGLRTG